MPEVKEVDYATKHSQDSTQKVHTSTITLLSIGEWRHLTATQDFYMHLMALPFSNVNGRNKLDKHSLSLMSWLHVK